MPTSADGKPRALGCPVYHGGEPPAITGTADWRPVEELLAADPPPDVAVVIVDRSMLGHVERFRRMHRSVVVVAADQEAATALGDRARVSMIGVSDPAARLGVLEASCELACARHKATRRWRYMAKVNSELDELLHLGMGLMHEHDRPTLLHKILDVGKRFTHSDGGVLILAEEPEGEVPRLRLALYEFDSLGDMPGIRGRTVPIDSMSIVGHAALTGKTIVVADAYDLPPDAGFINNREFDEAFGYHRKSMLIAPMVDQLGHRVGILVFVNRKTDPTARIRTKEDADRYVIPYTARELRLARSLASEAAVAIENFKLYSQIERTLEAFVKASVSAIDQRDPATSGHSVRVAALTSELASAVEQAATGPYRDVHFTGKQMRELRFAALLHDFGKVALRDDILLKAKKLSPVLWERVNARFDLIHRTLELEDCRHSDRSGPTLAEKLARLAEARRIVAQANEPSVTDQPPAAELRDIARRTFTLPDGTTAPYLTEEELHFLQITKGTLDARERAEVESHVSQTYEFLVRIPWTEDLKNLAPYAYGHHEKLSGAGYPRRLHGNEIPIQTRLITIADMFDALTEPDRPYKPAVPVEKAIDILESEAKAGLLDLDLVHLMTDTKAYQRILDADWHHL
jgi:HD-GYP domain-containing protein (c-di-GMP phosphodiesterase class II)